MIALINKLLDWFKALFWKEEMELTLVGLQYSGKTTFVNVIAVRFRLSTSGIASICFLHCVVAAVSSASRQPPPQQQQQRGGCSCSDKVTIRRFAWFWCRVCFWSTPFSHQLYVFASTLLHRCHRCQEKRDEGAPAGPQAERVDPETWDRWVDSSRQSDLLSLLVTRHQMIALLSLHPLVVSSDCVPAWRSLAVY